MEVKVQHVRREDREDAAIDSALGVTTPKALFFLAAGLSLAASVYLFFAGQREEGIFVGLWVPSILSAANLLIGSHDHE